MKIRKSLRPRSYKVRRVNRDRRNEVCLLPHSRIAHSTHNITFSASSNLPKWIILFAPCGRHRVCYSCKGMQLNRGSRSSTALEISLFTQNEAITGTMEYVSSQLRTAVSKFDGTKVHRRVPRELLPNQPFVRKRQNQWIRDIWYSLIG